MTKKINDDKIYDIIATVNFGLEAVVKRELLALGFDNLRVSDRKIEFKGNAEDIARCNIWLRSAERVYIKLTEFEALSFEELFEKTKAFNWPDLLPKDAEFPVQGRSYNSKLFSISDSQSIVKKAIVESLKEKYDTDWFSEDGPRYKLEIQILNDMASITLDTSGAGLHKRGYRDRAGDAPLKETLAAAMISLSFWRPERVLYDPFCGSGTIAIEAAMMAKNIAPGLDRDFDSMHWDIVGKDIYKSVKSEAMKMIDHDLKLQILGSDIDKRSILRARDNAANIGLSDDIQFFMKDMRDVDLLNNYGVVIANPPYGDRMGDIDSIKRLYRDFGKKFKELDTWSIYVLTSFEDFEKLYGRVADRKRKLYNAKLKVDYYQFYGPRPDYR
ncbi:MAG: class I SAM-dependent RNA methyltransferase [Tissierellia bacterium]|nr:class I SAM-dependent RNA methyltransferase [Tissierellia bacterium]